MAVRNLRTFNHQSNPVRRRGIWFLVLMIILILWPHQKKSVDQVTEEPTPATEQFLVLIHPGDGGNELGAVYPQQGDQPEIFGKNLNLQYAQTIKRALEKEGITVMLTRDSDIFIDAISRKEQAEQSKADLSLAIYTNSYYDDPLYSGFELIDYKRSDWEDNYKQRVALTRELERALEERLAEYDVKSHGVFTRNSAFVADIPTLVLLPGYISNEAERARLVTEDYQWQVANAVTDAVVIYRDRLRHNDSPPHGLRSEEVTKRLHLPF